MTRRTTGAGSGVPAKSITEQEPAVGMGGGAITEHQRPGHIVEVMIDHRCRNLDGGEALQAQILGPVARYLALKTLRCC